ncbi:tRNA (N6-isopentenyl adenosine(37)-C2)-methylthiotransferase MiaB, partial [Patescibacteria group bacterium]|nr:tRNA (N6-isopentenyl adenosine(37)-C2)-methylthiotransferase MiaB [Patescibacteria group bacterium]
MKKYHIITIGCQMNKSDSERIAGKLEELGYKRSDNKYQADLVIVNTCGVRQSAENRLYGLIPEIKRNNPKCFIVITGCLIYRKDIKKRLEKFIDEWLPVSEIFNFLPHIAGSIFRQFSNYNFQTNTKNIKCENNNYLNVQPKYESKFSAFVPIGNGCNNFCSYCVVPYARGREVYRSAEDILKDVQNLINKGYKEIILIAQNVNSYKYNENIKNNWDFPKLLKEVNKSSGDFWIRFLTSHPKDMSDKLIKTIASCEKVCHYIHLPIQSGDNEILKAMNRKYSVEHYINLIEKIRKNISDSSISTDVIVGFPNETKKQFNNTIKLFKQIKFDMVYISQYSPRPGTVAFKLNDNISKEEKKNRENKLLNILEKT